MNVLVVSASHSMNLSQTSLILNPFMDGMKDAGAKTEIIYLKKINLKPCKADLTCWFKHPEKCIIEDNFQFLKSAVSNKDLLVVATPVYLGGINSLLQTFFERLLPFSHSDFIYHKAHFGHKTNSENFPKKLFLVSSCSFFEKDNFKAPVAQMKNLAHGFSLNYIGALLRPHILCLFINDMLEEQKQIIIKNCYQAGKELINKGAVNSDILSTISSPLMQKTKYMKLVNDYFNEIKT